MTRPDLDAILPPVSTEDESTVDALLAKAREGVGKRPIGGRPSLDAIRARCDAATPGPWAYDDGTGYIEMGEAGYAEFKPDWERSVHKRPPLVARMTDTWGDTSDDGCFIAAARTDIPALLAYIDELERRTTYTVGETEWAQRIAVAEQRFVDEYDARRDVERQRDELLRVNKGAAQHGIITEHVRKLTELLGIQRQNPTANETVNAAATEIEMLRTTVEELKARITTLEAMR